MIDYIVWYEKDFIWKMNLGINSLVCLKQMMEGKLNFIPYFLKQQFFLYINNFIMYFFFVLCILYIAINLGHQRMKFEDINLTSTNESCWILASPP